jgi:hypothetical protein
MNWVIDNLQVLIFVAIAIAAIVQKLKKAEKGNEPPRPAPGSPEEAENTRKIQEEIRRRIMERRGLAPTTPGREEARPIPVAPPMIEMVRSLRVEPPPAVSPTLADEAAEYKRQQDMLEMVRALEAGKRTQRAAPAIASVATAASDSQERSLPALRNRIGLRQAVVLREILGPPVGLR